MSQVTIFLLLSAALVAGTWAWGKKGRDLSIAAFNVQVFGEKKMAKPKVVDALVDIIRRYDLVFFQEIRDSSNSSIYKLHNLINKGLRNKFKLFVSDRLGRSNSKEQYGFFYREDDVKLLGSWQSPDKGFERPPIVVEFQPLRAKAKKFIIIGCHIKPDDAEEEMAKLEDVYDQAKKRFGNDDAILMGDFNAGCSYVRKRTWMKHGLRGDLDFKWLIGDDAKTTTKGKGCPYARFVVTGDELPKKVVSKSAKTFFFDQKYKFDKKLTQQISDHYPIEMELD